MKASKLGGSGVIRFGVAGPRAKSPVRSAVTASGNAGWMASASAVTPMPNPTLPSWLRFGAHSGKIDVSAIHELSPHAAPQATQARR